MHATQPIGDDTSPFHAGEREIQSRLGVREDMEQWGRKIIRRYLPEQHREFYTLTWIGFSAMGESRGVVYVDNVVLKVE